MSFHIGAKKGEIAEIMLLPGDPLRAKFIAERFLEDISCYSTVRNMLGFTGTYNGTRISIQGAGMGIPSTAIYASELINEFGVKTMIRIGTCGSIRADIKLGEVILAMSASTDSSVNKLYFGGMDYAPAASFELLDKANQKANDLSIHTLVGGIFSTDTFYDDMPDRYKIWGDHGVLGVEMESTILYTLAARNNVRALSILTVSDNLVTGEVASAEDREKKIEDMAKIALEVTV
ncbi:MAG: purine-nucleoside phosphorylase [Cytophagales bacterium]|nr:purine-nucleoside phosphorylase [Cytophagales bacterium]